MDLIHKEHQRLFKRVQSLKSIDDVQATINLLQEARNSIERDPNSASITLAKLQNPVKTSFDTTNESLKETYSALNRYGRALDKLFKDKPLPSTDYEALSLEPALVDRAIAMHLLREGQFSTASTFASEASGNPHPTVPGAGTQDSTQRHIVSQQLKELQSGDLRNQFILMYSIMHELRDKQNLLPAIDWARKHRLRLEARGSNLEFELCRLQFVWLFHGGGKPCPTMVAGRAAALEYARKEFHHFHTRHLREVEQLMGAMAFCPNLEQSPYRDTFSNPWAWADVATTFTREFCALLGLSSDSPIYIAATAGAIALPTLLKLQSIMKEKRTEWTSQNELPVEIPLPPSYLFHSIFVCPVSKEQTTDDNPPMMMPCGHVVAQESLMKLSKSAKFKCPYCPGESSASDATKLIL
ncbi:hypothetical protein LOZ53_003104 [Ophidiomyces ophidiicola]|uniref:Uncharacterized protein n=1 Tax=Ophidiomyces ophidiicola TaxID=1387563 RepID=A0ACB8V553_9EURO|nr:uncharacterized protein LOZ57_005226 [Ophidiomyces ophidiicola]KAI1912889.1 hypothetical protein LOZ61_003093 [Ophidiomyces ophidiicola]KAI1917566.1 hypothetical protein LOZ64_003046 [Ophidiomyces ophidiicola]KAI1930760.1 hypothetical protein LOZ60_000736 [Ophidiomyces ophidiicola]KAI1942929.1 hypothetical protein LOZ57_005226 [Ophidiomyces ophidiicola]KAI1952031.1 hypothetical protein LOZ62_001560 [Ophidiomyces ophidiicola]